MKQRLSFLFTFIVASFTFLASQSATALIIPKPPQLNAKAYILIDANSGEVIVEHNADVRLPPASLTKMMTSYIATHELALGNLQEQDQVPVSIKAWSMGGSKMFIREGTNVPFIELLKGIIIQSGNDASVAVAEFIAGAEDSYVDVMNQHAARLGMKDTHFMNATGLPMPDHYTTARDLTVLAKAIVNDHPEYYGLYSEKYFKYGDIRQPNRNTMLWKDPSVDGLKTGHTEEAGYCLAASAKRNNMRLISVVLGTNSQESRARETQKLLTYGFRYFETHQLYQAAATIETQRIWGGQADQVEIGLTEDVVLTLQRGSKEQLEVETTVNEYLQAPIAQGDVLGSLVLRMDGEVLIERPLVALSTVEESGFFGQLWAGIKLFFMKLFGVKG